MTSTANHSFYVLALWSRKVVLASYGLLLLLFTVNTLVAPSCERDPNPTMWLLYCLPLLAFLPTLLKRSLRGMSWLCFVLLGYFMFAVLGAFTCPSYWVSLELAAIVCLFCATIFDVRWYARYLRAYVSRTNGSGEKESES